ncbi:MAG: cytochrome c oxidase accessory protein CcoG [Planctomycetota bacterium]|jgi:cytochrome c oxidase accessory protein FixG
MSESETLLQPEEHVLSTLEKDGSRRWLKPRLSPGRFFQYRRAVAYTLIALFTLIPYIRLNNKPLILLDVIRREFTLFGYTFLPTDTLLLALLVVGVIVGIFLVTALFGRLWCGWACPQTVYMEYVYRPIERLFDATVGRGGERKSTATALRKTLRIAVYLVVSMFLAHTFLAYFVGVENLLKWIRSSPAEHPIAFVVMAATTGLMMFDFVIFREQLCIIACPYGRLQSVLLDRQSLIIGFDKNRGEPRGKLRKNQPEDQGDCIDCELCVATCPTGIDIRDGLQMECIGCAQCIDACDDVMDRVDKPRGLIRYSSQDAIEGGRVRLLRPRVVLYPAIMAIVLTLLVVFLVAKKSADVIVLRQLGQPFVELTENRVANGVRVKIVNRSGAPARYHVTIADNDNLTVMADENPIAIEPGQTRTVGMFIVAPRQAFTGGPFNANIRVTDANDFTETLSMRLIGPVVSGDTPAPRDDKAASHD